MSAALIDPLALLASLPLDTGTQWGSEAEQFQWDDMRAFLDRTPGCPRRHLVVRGRGLSKTTDLAVLILALLLTEAPPRSRSFVYAADADQALIMLDRVAGFVERAQLGSLVEVGASTITHRSSGATVSIEASDGASAFGKLPWLQVVDEFSMWASTDNYKRLWSAITSAVTKVDGSRLIVISMGGSPSSLAAQWWPTAERSKAWRTSRHPGPAPWAKPEDVAADLETLSPSQYRQLVLGEFVEGDDALGSVEDFEACTRVGSAVLAPNSRHDYVAALDVGTRRDLTALAIGHSEQRQSGRVVVIDKVMYWRPGKGLTGRVDLAEVEAAVLRVCREYSVARLRFDRMQAEQLSQNIARAGLRVQEYVFSSTGAAKLARSLHVAVRDRAVSLPDDDELRTESHTVRMIETGAGLVRMSNPAGTHDDLLTAIAMVVIDLTEQPNLGGGGVWSPVGFSMAALRARPGTTAGMPGAGLLPAGYRNVRIRGAEADVAAAARAQTPAERAAGMGLVLEGSANDPSRVRRG